MRKISKKRRFHEQVHITDLLFSLGLLCLFTISSLTVLLIGAHVYKQTALDMKTNYTTRTALTYVAEKVRQHDSTSSISLGTLEDALELSDSIGGVSYITYIYEDENALKELFVQASQPVKKSQGEKILAIQNFSIEQAGENLLRFTVTDEENTSASLLIHIRSHSTDTKGGAS